MVHLLHYSRGALHAPMQPILTVLKVNLIHSLD